MIHHIRDQANVTGATLLHRGDGMPYCGMGGEHGFDFAELDPESTNLDLVVEAAEVLEGTVGLPARAIASAVHPARCSRERIGSRTALQ